MENLPPPPGDPGDLPEPHLHLQSEPLFRIHFQAGDHPTRWNELRTWGPAETCRFDPHPPPQGVHLGEGVSYAATDLPTALAEVFQGTWVIDRRRDLPQLAVWQPVRQLTLLDLTGEWPLLARATALINAGARETCRAWARTIRQAWPDLDGLRHRSTLTGRPTCVTLWSPAANSFPEMPVIDESLDHPDLRSLLHPAADAIGYLMI
jgi:hypothetical protein